MNTFKIDLQHYEETPKDGYGVFQLKDSKLEIELLEFKIKVDKIDDDKYVYSRLSDDKKIVSKVFTSKSPQVNLELAPLMPQNLPDRVTNYTMLKFNETLQIQKQSNTKFQILFPIEIGVFAVIGETRSLIECFSGDPSKSRYGMYGTPEDGVLCKTFSTSLDSNEKQNPFLNSRISINFSNETESVVSLSKLVFLSTNHDVHYKSNDVVTDGIACVIKEIMGNQFAEINTQTSETPSEFSTSPRIDSKTSDQFTMDKGFI